ncbi:hypothetical protein DFH08DRAFT_366475 [Mycena albidolilacea]|uniref:NAD(P)-binding protein n=1 Tax=Mycena albidolilacea TaxID=1033008 RepID=A0AAD7AKN9_9AGAR|nr:hypothetical protein DFH08DRAFT_366475 [Mycena albidolilacea]
MSSYVITGASRGIGLEFVRQLSANSENKVFALVRNKATATKLKNLARNNITILEADVTDGKALQLAAAEVSKATDNKLDYLINNAGATTDPGLTLDQFPDPEAVEKDLVENFRTNAISVVHSTNAFLPLLKNGSAKKVLTVGSALGDSELTLKAEVTARAGYSIAKAALNLVVAKYAAQYKAQGFVFLSINPGSVDTSADAISEPSAGTIAENTALFKAITTNLPNHKGRITPEESVRLQLEVFNRWTVEETGAFVSQHGSKKFV